MPASTYLGNAFLDLFLRGIAVTPPTGVFVSLHTADPGLTGANEVTTAAWPSYARKSASNGGAVANGFSAAAAKGSQNALSINFGAKDGAAPITITYFALWDAASAGNCLFVGPLDTPKTYNVTDEAIIHPFGLSIGVV